MENHKTMVFGFYGVYTMDLILIDSLYYAIPSLDFWIVYRLVDCV
jgi:hypothetical protein